MVSLHSNWGYSKLTRDYQALVVNSRIPPDVPRTFRAWFASTWSRTFWDRVNWTELVRVNIVSCGSPGYQGYLIDIQWYHARHPSQHITIRSELNGEQNRRSWLTWRWHYQASSYRPWNFLGTWRCDCCWWNHLFKSWSSQRSASGVSVFFSWPSPRVMIWREEMLSILFWEPSCIWLANVVTHGLPCNPSRCWNSRSLRSLVALPLHWPSAFRCSLLQFFDGFCDENRLNWKNTRDQISACQM